MIGVSWSYAVAQQELGTGNSELIDLKYCQKSFLRDFHRAQLLHPLFPLFLLFQQLALPGDVAAVALGQDVLAERRDRLSGDDLVADRGLNDDLEQLPGDQFLELLGDLAPPLEGLIAMDDHTEGVHRVAIDEHVESHQLRGAMTPHLVFAWG